MRVAGRWPWFPQQGTSGNPLVSMPFLGGGGGVGRILFELVSKLLKEDYIGDDVGERYTGLLRGMQGA